MAKLTVNDPAIDAIPVTPNDSVDLPGGVCSALLVVTAGNLHVRTAAGNERTIAVPAGVVPIQVRRVYSTGTTAASITALY